MLGQKSIKIKKKFLGKYSGSIPSYEIQLKEGMTSVDAVEISFVLKKDYSIEIQIGKEKKESRFTVLERNKNNYTIEVRIPGEKYIEKLELKGKEKILFREGLYPQPKAHLSKD